VGVYFALPDGEDVPPLAQTQESADAATEPLRLEIVEVTPADASPGAAVTVTYIGAEDAARVQVFAGKMAMEVLARHKGSLVARLPTGLPPGRVKLRAVQGSERSKPYDVRLKAVSWRKPFRNLIGGFALLIFGIGVLARGAREAAGIGSAHALARVAGRGPAALGLGAVVGALAQSTTAAAGLLAGLVSSSLLAVGPAAIAFLGAELGAATAPLVTGLIDPREGLVVVAIGVLWHALASDRRSLAFSRLLLGAGLIALGLQTLRPGFEPFVQEPSLLALVARLNTHGVLDVAVCALLGALLVALLQGPAPVVVLVLVLAQTTAQWDLNTALAVLSGSGLGAGLGALLTTPAGRRCRRFAILNLLLGAASTVFAAATHRLWSHAADWLVPGVPHEISWGKRILLPNLGLHLGVAFGIAQLAAVFALLPVAPLLARWLERRYPDVAPRELSSVGDPLGVIRSQLFNVLSMQAEALNPLGELVQRASRSAGRAAEHTLAEAHSALEELLIGPISSLEDSSQGRKLARAAFTSLQLQRSLEGLHRQAERLVDRRVAASSGSAEVAPLAEEDAATLKEMHGLLLEGAAEVLAGVSGSAPVDLDTARAREIRLNGLEARSRGGVLLGNREALGLRSRLGVLELVDAYESAGNQFYRLSEAISEGYVELGARVG
jgi:Na+/phosphate symporter